MVRSRPPGPITRRVDGAFNVNLNEDERSAFIKFFSEFEDLLNADSRDDNLRRLFPVAYHDNLENDGEFQRLMHDDLVASKRASLEISRRIMLSTADDVVAEADMLQLMTTLNGLRLVLGTMLDVGEDDGDIDDDDPLAGQRHLYEYIGWLLEWVVAGLHEGFEPDEKS
ncbi:MAG: DUF2017 domain-containing protein [Ilumatobacteraceae bacterium]|jgi:hypothetical protein|nr:DUF2017 domain-containing protein [Ilumatobacteraceae bacterium]